jgi:hypothetical protein
VKKLNPNSMPEPLRDWIPFAELWGQVEQGIAQSDYPYEERTYQEFMDLMTFLHTRTEEQTKQFNEVFRSRYPAGDTIEWWSDEDLALQAMLFRLEDIQNLLIHGELPHLLGLTTFSGIRTELGKNVERYLSENLTLDVIHHTITLNMWLKMKDRANLPFQIHILRCHSVSFRMIDGIGQIDGYQNTFNITLRTDSREFVFPEVRHCSIDTNRFLLEAEYEEIEILKEW